MLNDYIACRAWLESFIPLVYGKKELGLKRIENLLEKLGNPQNKFKSILVGGTAGKGSTAFYISQLLAANKLKVGLHISPHLVYIGERMQINWKEIPVRRLVGLANQIKPVVEDIKRSQVHLTPSYFEILVAISFLYFAKEKVDFAVVEVGLGGRLDATNILESEISVITNVGLDHTELLGNTIEEIAKEKAGIIKNNTLVVTGAAGKALKVIEKVAKAKKAPLITLDTRQDLKTPKSDIFGYIRKYYYLFRSTDPSFASQNKNLALLTGLGLGIVPDADSVKKAFSAGFPGRFEQVDGVVLDGAHNADKIKALIDFVRNSKFEVRNPKQIKKSKIQNPKSIILILAFKKGKRWKKMIDLLIKNFPVKKVVATEYKAVTDTGLRSAVDAEKIAEYLSNDKRLTTKVIRNSQEAVFTALSAIKLTSNQLVLVTGSLYLVGEVRTLWYLPEF